METQKPTISPVASAHDRGHADAQFGEKTQLQYLRAVRQFSKYLDDLRTLLASRSCATTSCTWSTAGLRRHR